MIALSSEEDGAAGEGRKRWFGRKRWGCRTRTAQCSCGGRVPEGRAPLLVTVDEENANGPSVVGSGEKVCAQCSSLSSAN
jgi:hypothetical protein